MIGAFLTLAACASRDDSREPHDSATDDSAVDDSATEKSCTLVGAISLSSTDVMLPSAPVVASVDDAGSGRKYTVAWDASNGELASAKGPTVSWEANDSVAVHGPESISIRATASADGCDPQIVEATLDADWPDSERTVVIYNPIVVESRDVALYYQAFRGVPDEGLCAIESAATSRLAAADFPTWIRSEQDCLDRLHGRARYIVPVYGVPFELAGVVKDLFYETYVTTSLDAQMVFGEAALALLDAASDYPIRNPAYLPGDSDTQTYTTYTPFPELWPTIAEDAAFADTGVAPQYYMVARIDGSSLTAALELVERTERAEKLAQSGALEGIVYVDGRYGDEPPETDFTGSYEAGEWNMWGTRYLFEDLGWYDVVWDGNDAEFGTAPAPTECPEALYFAGWYSYDHYNGCFEWAPGAIGGHLDSASAGDVRGGTNWTHQALEAGITATFGAVEEPYVAGMPEYDQFFLYLTSGASFGEAAYESTLLAQWMMVWVGDPLYRPHPQ
jgi:uncharacterized protein (TIGR03790 family)